MREPLVEAWRGHNRINLSLLDHISPEGLRATLSARGGRDVARQFAHLHDVRVHQLENRARDLADPLEKFQAKGQPAVSPTKAQLKRALVASGEAVEEFLLDVLEGVPKRRPFKRGLFATFGYFVSHESHHRGSILLTLKQAGHPIDRAARYDIWTEWGRG